MSKALAVVNEYTREQLELIKSTVAKGASDDEFKLFIYRCKHMDLDPLKPGQVHFVKYGNAPGVIIVGIDGFRIKAARTGKHVGTKRGVIRDDSGKCIGAFCEVSRSDWKEPAREEVSLAEYMAEKANWKKMPETMIKKVAEAAALRMAFPDELGGVYTNEEMDQADMQNTQRLDPVTVPSIVEEMREEAIDNGHYIPEALKDEDFGEFKCNFGRKFKDKRIRDIDPFELDGYIQWLIQSAVRTGQGLHPSVQIFVDKAEAYLKQHEFERQG